MIQAFFFDLQAINSGSLRPQGIEPFKATKVGVLGAGMMGAGIAYSCARAGMEVVLKDVAVEAAEKGKAYSREAARQGDLARQLDRGEEGRAARPDHRRPPTRPTWPAATWSSRRSSRTRPEGQGVRRDPAARQPRRAAVLQHLDAADHRARRRRGPARRTSSACTSSRPVDKMPLVEIIKGARDLRRGAGQGLRRRPADPEDPDRGQRQPRLLHLAGDRHDGQRGPGDARRGRAPGLARAGGHPGRLPGRPAAALRRAQHGADGQDRARRPRRPPSATGTPYAAPGRPRSSTR